LREKERESVCVRESSKYTNIRELFLPNISQKIYLNFSNPATWCAISHSHADEEHAKKIEIAKIPSTK